MSLYVEDSYKQLLELRDKVNGTLIANRQLRKGKEKGFLSDHVKASSTTGIEKADKLLRKHRDVKLRLQKASEKDKAQHQKILNENLCEMVKLLNQRRDDFNKALAEQENWCKV